MNDTQFKHYLISFHEEVKKPPPLIMGILNLTPDSFSDGGLYLDKDRAVEKALTMIAQGADIIDIGAESSRPGASPISEEEERQRLLPVIKALQTQTDTCLSIDTTKPKVMDAALRAGASMINDIQGLNSEEALAIVKHWDVPVCLMHMFGLPPTMQNNLKEDRKIINEINHFFQEKIIDCLRAGIRRENIIIDPGFGFGKTDKQNIDLVNCLQAFRSHGLPVLLGCSRKSTIGNILNASMDNRLVGGLTLAILAQQRGVSIIRTHDVEATYQAFQMLSYFPAEM